MLKQKYLHRKHRKDYHHYDWKVKHRDKNVDIFSDLPFHENIRKKSGSRYLRWDCRPLDEFISSKVGCKWDDVYSEILTKIKKKYRNEVDRDILYHVELHPIYDNDFIPRSKKCVYNSVYNTNRGILINRLFVDLNGFLVCKTEEEIINDSIKYKRRLKLQEILDNLNKDKDEG